MRTPEGFYGKSQDWKWVDITVWLSAIFHARVHRGIWGRPGLQQLNVNLDPGDASACDDNSISDRGREVSEAASSQRPCEGKRVVGEGNPNECSYWGTNFREFTCERGLPTAQAGAHTSLGQEVSLWHAKSQEISFRSFPTREVSYFACKVCVFLCEMEFFASLCN